MQDCFNKAIQRWISQTWGKPGVAELLLTFQETLSTRVGLLCMEECGGNGKLGLDIRK
jgi:hypothetical protein